MTPDDFLDARELPRRGLDVLPRRAELDVLAPGDFVQIISRHTREWLWIMITGTDDDAIIGTVFTDRGFSGRVVFQRHHVSIIAPWMLLPLEQQQRIRGNAITAENRKWMRQLTNALDSAAMMAQDRRLSNKSLSRFDLERRDAELRRQYARLRDILGFRGEGGRDG